MFHCNYFIKQLRNSFQGKIASSMYLRCSPTFGFDDFFKHHARMDDTVLNIKALVLFYFLIFLYVLKCDPNFTKQGTKNYAKHFHFLFRDLRFFARCITYTIFTWCISCNGIIVMPRFCPRNLVILEFVSVHYIFYNLPCPIV